MATIRARSTGAIVGALVISGFILAMPSRCRSQVLNTGPTIAASDAQAAIPPQSESAATATGDTSAPAHKTLRQRVKSLVEKLTPDRIKRNREFAVASAQFPDFCKHWEQNLRDREVNNLSKLNFVPKDGYETATYTGYGKIAGCESHQSKDGYSIGKLSYEEFIYYVAGKTREEARMAAPKMVQDTHTTEIFRWENNKWFY
jgi:hypothetical protein